MRRSRNPRGEGASRSDDLPAAVRSWTCVEILLSIAKRPSDATDLAKRHGLDRSVVTKHLRALAASGLAGCVQARCCRVYTLRDNARVHWSAVDVEISLWSQDSGHLLYRVPIATLRRNAPWLFEDPASVAEVKPATAPRARPRAPRNTGA